MPYIVLNTKGMDGIEPPTFVPSDTLNNYGQ